MPLLKVSQTHECLNQPPRNTYLFSEDQRGCWKKFWAEMDGDSEKILEFAKKTDIENPDEWFQELHRFLFSSFAELAFVKKAAGKNFNTFLEGIVESHIKEPKDRNWYYALGVNKQDYLRVLKAASEVKELRNAVAYINARMVDYGAKLYSEFILLQAPKTKEIRSIASMMNKQAEDIEKKSTGKTIVDKIKTGDKVYYLPLPNEEFTVDGFEKETSNIRVGGKTTKFERITAVRVKDKNGYIGYVFDTWNLA